MQMNFKEGSGSIPSLQWRQQGAKELLELLPQLRKAAEANCVAGSPCLEAPRRQKCRCRMSALESCRQGVELPQEEEVCCSQ